ncbi:MAG: transposase [Candidatus Methanomethylicaceae archaeon]
MELCRQTYNYSWLIGMERIRCRAGLSFKPNCPRFKGKGWYKTFVYNQSGFRLIKTGKRLDVLPLSKIGSIPIRVHRTIEGRIKQVVIKRHNSGRWSACVCVEREVNFVQREPKYVVGLDVGIKHFLTDSDGRQIENPKFYERTERIRVIQHWLSRKRKGSKNREKENQAC